MRIFQRLLLTPAMLGILAPVAVAETNVPEVSKRAATSEQVTSVFQFSDIYPTDWAYQALSSLVEQYGCVAGYPNRAFRGNRAMTRFEAAALLNACLNRVGEVTDGVRRLTKEFEAELAVLGGRADGLEARIGELEATRFSTTTKLRGKTDFVIGGTGYTSDYESNDLEDQNGNYLGTDAIAFSYRQTIDINSSFSGKDLLQLRVRSGNFGENAFSGKGYTGKQAQVEWANSNADTLKVDKLWYQFPLGDDFMAYIGAKIEADQMLATQPSIYRHILKQFDLGGYYGAYSTVASPGIGINWKGKRNSNPDEPKLSFSANYVAQNGNVSNPTRGGIGNDDSQSKLLTQIAYGNPQWQVSAAYSYIQGGATVGYGTPLATSTEGFKEANAIAVNAYWQPGENIWIPNISAAWGLTDFTLLDNSMGGVRDQSQNWFVGFNWKDAFAEGNLLGFAVGGPGWVTESNGPGTPNDGNMAFELYYKFQVTDNISITPAAFYLSRPFGEKTGTSYKYGGLGNDSFGTVGYLLQTNFKF
ncbi:porin [cyanobiont of Ornithocercus magnificus]|nr:porin [cyanobiont of Ornithocercus magnificus]